MDILTARLVSLSRQTDLSWNTKASRNWIRQLILTHCSSGTLETMRPQGASFISALKYQFSGHKVECRRQRGHKNGPSAEATNLTPRDRHTSCFIYWYRRWTTLSLNASLNAVVMCARVCICEPPSSLNTLITSPSSSTFIGTHPRCQIIPLLKRKQGYKGCPLPFICETPNLSHWLFSFSHLG